MRRHTSVFTQRSQIGQTISFTSILKKTKNQGSEYFNVKKKKTSEDTSGASTSCLTPRVEWRELKIGGGNLIHQKVFYSVSSDFSRFDNSIFTPVKERRHIHTHSAFSNMTDFTLRIYSGQKQTNRIFNINNIRRHVKERRHLHIHSVFSIGQTMPFASINKKKPTIRKQQQ